MREIERNFGQGVNVVNMYLLSRCNIHFSLPKKLNVTDNDWIHDQRSLNGFANALLI